MIGFAAPTPELRDLFRLGSECHMGLRSHTILVSVCLRAASFGKVFRRVLQRVCDERYYLQSLIFFRRKVRRSREQSWDRCVDWARDDRLMARVPERQKQSRSTFASFVDFVDLLNWVESIPEVVVDAFTTFRTKIAIVMWPKFVAARG